jgi:hypothetical protein
MSTHIAAAALAALALGQAKKIDPTAVTTIALTKAIPKKEADAARTALTPGKYPVDFVARITGTMSVGAHTEKTATVSIPLKEVLALFIARSGITRESSIKLLSECLTDALKGDNTKATGAVAAASDIDAEFER